MTGLEMNRFTHQRGSDYFVESSQMPAALCKLAEYENTGLSPEAVRMLRVRLAVLKNAGAPQDEDVLAALNALGDPGRYVGVHCVGGVDKAYISPGLTRAIDTVVSALVAKQAEPERRKHSCPHCGYEWWEDCDATDYPYHCPHCGGILDTIEDDGPTLTKVEISRARAVGALYISIDASESEDVAVVKLWRERPFLDEKYGVYRATFTRPFGLLPATLFPSMDLGDVCEIPAKEGQI